MLQDQWVEKQGVHLPYAKHFPSITDQRAASYYPYHRRRGHQLEQCVSFSRLFDEKLKAGEILHLERGTTNVHKADIKIEEKVTQ